MKAWFPVVLAAVLGSACGRTGGVLPARGVFVAVGSEGQAFVSEDGTAWAAATTPTRQTLLHLASGAGRFVAVGAKGTILSSVDGEGWVQHPSQTNTDLSSVTWTGERFVAVGGDWSDGAAALASTDGVTWVAIASPSSQMFRAVVSRGDELLVASNLKSDLQTPSLYSMKQGAPWQVDANGPTFAHGLTDAAGRTFLVGWGEGARSDDGVTWSPLGLGGAHSVATSGSNYLAVGEIAGVWSSPDGTRWTQSRVQSGAYFLTGIAYGRGHYVAVGEPGFAIVDPDTSAANTRIATVGQVRLNDIAFGPVQSL
jgi:hypothetical protein